MSLVRRVARPLMASMYLLGGVDQVRNPSSKRAIADDVAPRVAGAVNASPVPVTLPTDTDALVRLNGVVMIVGGAMLGLGKFPRVGATLLAGALAPTTLAAHSFWSEPEDAKDMQRIHFLKNLSMLGGLLLAAADTGSRESLPRAARRAAKDMSTSARRGATDASRVTELAVERARRRGAAAAFDARRASLI